MKSLGLILLIFISLPCQSQDLEYPSYAGAMDSGRTPLSTESPLYSVKDTTEFPFRTVGRLGTGCTGSLIGPKHILTAAHCVYSMNNNEYYSELTFSPGQSGSTLPYGSKDWDKVIAPREWTVNHNEDFDFALITLKENVGNDLGWMGLKVESSPYKKTVQIAGYAGSKVFGTMWSSSCQLLAPTSLWLDYDCETESGMSGSSVAEVNESRTNFQVIGIHALGGDEYNSAVRITSDVYKTILSWKK